MTQAFNLAQLANNLNTSGQLDATDGLIGLVANANLASSGTADSTTFLRGDRTWQTVSQKLVQVVSASTTTAVTSTSSALVDVLSLSITPTSASNKILALCSFAYIVDDVNDGYHEAAGTSYLLRGATTLNYNTYLTYVSGESRSQSMRGYGGYIFMDSPATTSSTTYKLQISANDTAYSIQVPYSGTTCSLILAEVVV